MINTVIGSPLYTTRVVRKHVRLPWTDCIGLSTWPDCIGLSTWTDCIGLSTWTDCIGLSVPDGPRCHSYRTLGWWVMCSYTQECLSQARSMP